MDNFNLISVFNMDCKSSEKVVYLALCAVAAEDNVASISFNELADMTGLCRRTIVSAINALIKKEIIQKQSSNKKNETNQYKIL